MSKCDISIQLDKGKREFRNDESVTGTIDLQVNKNVQCRSLVVSGYWKTHGRGNRDSGKYSPMSLYSGKLQSGQTYSYPFVLPTDKVPLTYRGKLINLDHYLDVRIDIPWKLDPKKRTDFVLLPGSAGRAIEPSQPVASLGIQIGRIIAVVISAVLCLVGIATLWACVGILPLGAGITIGYFALRKTLAERRLGSVTVTCESALVAPGDLLPLQLSCTPRKGGKITNITARLVGKEKAISGSGTNKSTHTHKFYDKTFELAGKTSFNAHEPLTFNGQIQIPDSNAYSFHTGDNSVYWKLTLCIDIPHWPDWRQVINLALVPRPLLHPEASPPPSEPAPTPSVDPEGNSPLQETVTQAATVVAASTAVADTPPPPEAIPEPTSPLPAETTPPPVSQVSLPETCDHLNASGNSRSDQDRILAAITGHSFPVTLIIDSIDSTYSWEKDSPYSDGKTLRGLLDGTSHEIEIQVPSDRNPVIEQLRSGDSWSGTGTITGRDSLFNRIKMIAD